MSFSPNMKAAYERYPNVCAAHKLEVDRRWSRRSKRIPYAGKLHIAPACELFGTCLMAFFTAMRPLAGPVGARIFLFGAFQYDLRIGY